MIRSAKIISVVIQLGNVCNRDFIYLFFIKDVIDLYSAFRQWNIMNKRNIHEAYAHYSLKKI